MDPLQTLPAPAAEILGHLVAQAASLPGFSACSICRSGDKVSVELAVVESGRRLSVVQEWPLDLLGAFRLGKVKDVSQALFQSQMLPGLERQRQQIGRQHSKEATDAGQRQAGAASDG